MEVFRGLSLHSFPLYDKVSLQSKPMNKVHMEYFENGDILHLAISDEPEAGSVELSPNITAELNESGELIGIEILNASMYVRDSIMESAQARMLRIPNMQTA
jgi:uncharacterized protein YuzE